MASGAWCIVHNARRDARGGLPAVASGSIAALERVDWVRAHRRGRSVIAASEAMGDSAAEACARLAVGNGLAVRGDPRPGELTAPGAARAGRGVRRPARPMTRARWRTPCAAAIAAGHPRRTAIRRAVLRGAGGGVERAGRRWRDAMRACSRKTIAPGRTVAPHAWTARHSRRRLSPDLWAGDRRGCRLGQIHASPVPPCPCVCAARGGVADDARTIATANRARARRRIIAAAAGAGGLDLRAPTSPRATTARACLAGRFARGEGAHRRPWRRWSTTVRLFVPRSTGSASDARARGTTRRTRMVKARHRGGVPRCHPSALTAASRRRRNRPRGRSTARTWFAWSAMGASRRDCVHARAKALARRRIDRRRALRWGRRRRCRDELRREDCEARSGARRRRGCEGRVRAAGCRRHPRRSRGEDRRRARIGRTPAAPHRRLELDP